MKAVGMNLQIYCSVWTLCIWRLIGAVDQPVGAGFSYVNTNSYLHELPEVRSLWVSGLISRWQHNF